ncbi:MAG: ATP-grasp domain-containing protein [Candidatus Rokuibacteriota bacterium]
MDRLLLLLPTTTYRIEDFLDAAQRLRVDLVCASEAPSTFERHAPDRLLTLDFADPAGAANAVARFAHRHPIRGVVGVDDSTTVVAAAIAARLGLRANSIGAATAARNKRLMRERLAVAGVRQPAFRLMPLEADPLTLAQQVVYPCVLKPLALSASRGVIRADDPAQFAEALLRLRAILGRDDITVDEEAKHAFLVESFVPGFEVALEGLLVDGELRPLAIFDKPDPLDGPFFEETIYVTPSRLSHGVQKAIAHATAEACQALGLGSGPVHAELRLNDAGPWVIEVASRSIGGLCSRTLRFGTGMSLEELILRQALGWPLTSTERETLAAGVMMIPIPRGGRLAAVHGVDAAKTVTGIEDVVISAHLDQELIPLPEGWQYLGFIFARAETPGEVETALREAHGRLRFDIADSARRPTPS